MGVEYGGPSLDVWAGLLTPCTSIAFRVRGKDRDRSMGTGVGIGMRLRVEVEVAAQVALALRTGSLIFA